MYSSEYDLVFCTLPEMLIWSPGLCALLRTCLDLNTYKLHICCLFFKKVPAQTFVLG